jgi:hypothetical protein
MEQLGLRQALELLDLRHTVSGLQPNTSVTILVRASGSIPCQTSISDAVTGRTLIDQIYVPNAFNPNSSNPANRVLRVYGYVIQTHAVYGI